MKQPEINSIVMKNGFWITLEVLEHDTSEPYSMFLQKIIADNGNYNIFLRQAKSFLIEHKFIKIWKLKPLGQRYITLTEKGEVLKAYITKLRQILNET